MRIVWTEDDRLIPFAGHGVDFFAGDSAEPARLVAVVRGFEWLHGQPETVEVYVRPESDAIDMATLAAARPVIERYLRSRQTEHGQVTPTLYANING